MNEEKIEFQPLIIKGDPKYGDSGKGYKGGYYGHVYHSLNGRATKIFLRHRNATDEIVPKVFLSEVDAYKKVSKVEELLKITPKFFGPVRVSQVLDYKGIDKSEDYFLDCAYQMEYIEGQFEGFNWLDSSIYPIWSPQVKDIKKLFYRHGISYTEDASVLRDKVAQKIRYIIDFATVDPMDFNMPTKNL